MRAGPSLDATKIDGQPRKAPPGIAVRAILAARRSLQRAADALTPPGLAMFEKVTGAGASFLIGEVARLGIADRIGDGAKTSDQLARETQTSPDAMKRTMRALVAAGVFTRDSAGRYANNRLSAMLRSDVENSVRAFAEYFASRSNVHAWADFPEILRTGKNGFERVWKMSVWDWFDAHPHERETFAHAMMAMTLVDAPGIAEAYPFGDIEKLCDVGGGRGTLLSEILLHHRRLKGMLVDAPGVLESAAKFLELRGVRSRVVLAPGSFFEKVPPGADAYLLKNILHDWDDARCLVILRAVRKAMKPGQKLLVVEALVEEDCDGFGAFADIQMMVVCCDGRERGRHDFERLFEESGFSLARIVEAPTPIAIIEGVAR